MKGASCTSATGKALCKYWTFQESQVDACDGIWVRIFILYVDSKLFLVVETNIDDHSRISLTCAPYVLLRYFVQYIYS